MSLLDKTISDLPAAVSLDGTEVFPVDQAGTTKKATVNLASAAAIVALGSPGNFSITATGSTMPRTLSDRFSDIVSVKDFGAVGDDSTDDAPAFNAAVSGLAASGGGTIQLGPKTYKLGSTVNLDRRVKMVGCGPAATILHGAHSGKTLAIEDVSTDGLVLADMTIKGNGSSTGLSVGSATEHTAHANLRNLRFWSHAKGIATKSASGTYAFFDTLFEKIDFLSCSTFGEELGGSGVNHVGCTYRLCGEGIRITQPNSGLSIGGGTFVGGTFIGNTYDIMIATATVRQTAFYGTWFEQTVTSSVATSEVGEVFLVGMSFEDCLFQPAATATGGGVFSPASIKGLLGFSRCRTYYDLYASASPPDPLSYYADTNVTFISENNCLISGAGAVTPSRSGTNVGASNPGLRVASGALGYGQSGLVFHNTGAGALTTFTLPPAAAGFEYEFVVMDTDGIRVVAGAGDDITVGGSTSAAAGRIDSTTLYSSAKLRCMDDTHWVAVATNNIAAWTVT